MYLFQRIIVFESAFEAYSSLHNHCCHYLTAYYFDLVEFFCSEPPLVSNGQHNTSQIRQQAGITVKYSCNPGYQLDGEQTITCEKNKWVGTPPICKAHAVISGGNSQADDKLPNSDPITDKGGCKAYRAPSYVQESRRLADSLKYAKNQ